MKNGTYKYKHPTYNGGVRTYVEYEMRVTVVNQRANKYQVKYLGFHASGAAVNSLHWVRKDKVRLDTPEPIIITPPARDIRLPYID